MVVSQFEIAGCLKRIGPEAEYLTVLQSASAAI